MNLVHHILIADQQLYVTWDYLLSFGISENTIKAGTKRYREGNARSWENDPEIKLGQKSLVKFDSINFSKIHPFNMEGGPAAPIQSNLLKLYNESSELEKEKDTKQNFDQLNLLIISLYKSSDKRYFVSQGVNKGRANGQDRADGLATSIAILQLATKFKNKKEIKITTGYESKEQLYRALLAYIESQDIYGLPRSYDRFRATASKFKKTDDKRTILLNGNRGNDSAKRFNEVHEAVALELLLNPQKIDLFECWRDYSNYMVTQYEDINPVKYSRFKQIAARKDIQVLMAKCRMGDSYYETHVRPHVLRKKPNYSMSVISGDGWEPGRSVVHTYIDRKTGKKLKSKGTMNVWVWYDWKSSMIVGHEISHAESSEDIRRSFRDVVNFHNVCPMSVAIDKKWANQKDTKQMFESADVTIQDKRAYNPKANIAERYHKELNKIHRRIDEYWVDMTNNTDNTKHNPEHVRKGKSMQEAEFRKMVLDIINIYNDSPKKSLVGKTPREVFEASINPECRQLTPIEQVFMFGVQHPKPAKITSDFRIQFDIASRQYTFLIPKENIAGIINSNAKKVKVYYDERYMESIDIYSFDSMDDIDNDILLCTCYNADQVRVNPTKVEGDFDERKFGKQNARGLAVDQFIDDKLKEIEETKDIYAIDAASVKAISQEKYKEVLSTQVAKQYSDYHNEMDYINGHEVATDKTSKTHDMDVREKSRRLREQLAEKLREEDY